MVCLGLHRCSQYSGGLVDLVDKTICFIDKIFINKISRTDKYNVSRQSRQLFTSIWQPSRKPSRSVGSSVILPRVFRWVPATDELPASDKVSCFPLTNQVFGCRECWSRFSDTCSPAGSSVCSADNLSPCSAAPDRFSSSRKFWCIFVKISRSTT